MPEIINLRQARKRRKRREKERPARENRARFGRSGKERKLTEALRDSHIRHVDGHRRDDGGEDK